MASLSDFVGYTAGVCTTISFAPQVIKILRTRSTRDISLGMYLVLALGIALWLVHGFQVGSHPMVATNTVSLTLVLVILGMKLHYK